MLSFSLEHLTLVTYPGGNPDVTFIHKELESLQIHTFPLLVPAIKVFGFIKDSSMQVMLGKETILYGPLVVREGLMDFQLASKSL